MTSTPPDPSQFTQGADDRARPGDDPAAAGGLAGSVANLLDTYARILSQLAGGPGTTPDGAPEQMGTGAALIEAGSIASASTLRYGQRLTELFARHKGALVDAIPAHLSKTEPTPAELRAEAEALRAFLREVGETALQEARRLDHELAQLGEAVAQGVADTMSQEDYQRRWETKP